MPRGVCVDCDKTVEVTPHGTCSICGSGSVVKIQFNRILNATAPELEIGDVMVAAEKVLERLGQREHTSTVEVAALQLISARLARFQGLTLGQHLENTITMWHVAFRVDELAEGDDAKGN